MKDNPVSVSCTPAHRRTTWLMWCVVCMCVTLKRKGTETGGQRKLSSEPEEVGLPGGGVIIERGEWAGFELRASRLIDTNYVFKVKVFRQLAGR